MHTALGGFVYGTNRGGHWAWMPQMMYWIAYNDQNPPFALAVDGDGSAHVVYAYTYSDEATGNLKAGINHFTNSSLHPAATPWFNEWTIEAVDYQQEDSWGFSIPGAGGVSIAVDSQGTIGVAGAFQRHVPTGSLAYASLVFYERTGNSWTREVVATTADGYVAGDGSTFADDAPYLLFDGFHRPHIAFADISSEHVDGANYWWSGQIRHA